MLGKRVNISAPTSGMLYAIFSIDTTQSMSSWTGRGVVYDPTAPTTVLVTMTISLDPSAKTLTATLDQDSVQSLLSSGDSVVYSYDILVDPNLNDDVRFFYGDFTVVQAGPEKIEASPSSSPSTSPSPT